MPRDKNSNKQNTFNYNNINDRTTILNVERKKPVNDDLWYSISGIILIFLTIISAARITLIGQFFDDSIFAFLFGWFKYIIYFLLIGFEMAMFFRIKFHFKPRFIIMMITTFVCMCWFITSILIIVAWAEKTKGFLINDYFKIGMFRSLFNSYVSNWKAHSLYGLKKITFFKTDSNTYFNLYAGGGVFGIFWSGIFCYLTIFGNLIFCTFILFFNLSWILTGDALFLFKKKKNRNGKRLRILSLNKQTKLKKKTKNDNKNSLFKMVEPNVMKSFEPQMYTSRREYDLTIEMPSNFSSRRQSYFDENYDQIYNNAEKNVKLQKNENYMYSNLQPNNPLKYDDSGYINAYDQKRQQLNNNFQINKNADSSFNIESKYENPNYFQQNQFQPNNHINQFNDQNLQKSYYKSSRENQNNDDKNYYSNNNPNYPQDNDLIVKREKFKRYSELGPFGANGKTNEILADRSKYRQASIEDFDFVEKTFETDKSQSIDKFETKENSVFKNYDEIISQYDKPKNKITSKTIEPEEDVLFVNPNYELPSDDILDEIVLDNEIVLKNEAFAKSKALAVNNTYAKFGVDAFVSKIQIGSSVVKLEVTVGEKTRVNDVVKFNQDIRYALSTNKVIFEAPIEGKQAIGLEFPSKGIASVSFKEAVAKIPLSKNISKLSFPVGKDVNNNWIIGELDKTPHLLIAGSTGSGKSVMVNSIICAILMRVKPYEVKFLLIDPKRVELSYYDKIPHLVCPVISDMNKAGLALEKMVEEMERRYDMFNHKNVKHIEQFNKLMTDKKKRLPYIVVVIDELSDLMNVSRKEVEASIQRLTQMARACGIHLILATQRPSADVITGTIKTNIPTRIAFAVTSAVDSKIILDGSGADLLNGKGDMLYMVPGSDGIIRAQGCFIKDSEIERIVQHACNQEEVHYMNKFERLEVVGNESNYSISKNHSEKTNKEDTLIPEIIRYITQRGSTSTSEVQRKFGIGYNRASNIIDKFEEDGLIGPIGSGPNQKRIVYVKK